MVVAEYDSSMQCISTSSNYITCIISAVPTKNFPHDSLLLADLCLCSVLAVLASEYLIAGKIMFPSSFTLTDDREDINSKSDR